MRDIEELIDTLDEYQYHCDDKEEIITLMDLYKYDNGEEPYGRELYNYYEDYDQALRALGIRVASDKMAELKANISNSTDFDEIERISLLGEEIESLVSDDEASDLIYYSEQYGSWYNLTVEDLAEKINEWKEDY